MSAQQVDPITDCTQERQPGDDLKLLSQTQSERAPAVRCQLPDERHALTHHFSIAGQEGYLTVGIYDDGLPGEIFITMAKQGSTISGLMNSFAIAVSLALQYGVPLGTLCNKFTHTRFEPSGWSENPKIGYATSLVDYIFRWLELKFISAKQGELVRLPSALIRPGPPANPDDPVGGLGQLIPIEATVTEGDMSFQRGKCHQGQLNPLV